MSKKIKYIISIIITLILLCISGNILAAVPEYYQSEWNNQPNNVYPIWVDNGNIYYCRERDRALRLYVRPSEETYTGSQSTLWYNSPQNAAESGIDEYVIRNHIGTILGEITGQTAYIETSGRFSAYNKGFDSVQPGDIIGNLTTVISGISETLKSSSAYSPAQTFKMPGIRTINLACKPTYHQEGETKHVSNSVTAYIMSAGKNWVPDDYDKRNYTQSVSDTASIADRQEALWLHQETFGEIYNIGNSYNTNNRALYDEAKEYKEFYDSNIANGYDASISLVNTTNQHIIVNKNNGTFTVGPYVAYYPDNSKFSYIEDMYIIDQDGKRIEINRVILEDDKTYPGSGQYFFIEFKYDTNPTNIKLYADFAYLQTTEAKYNELVGEGDIVYWEVKLTVNTQTKQEVEQDPNGTIGSDPMFEDWWDDINLNETYKIVDKYGINYSYSIELIDTGNNYTAQAAAEFIEASRTWTKTTRSVDTKSEVEIFMQIGGKVFVDEPATKESSVDGIYSSDSGDRPMSNVTVHLYSKKSGTEIASTKTDVNGNYVFEGLNVLDQYYVKFDYNGQYYEPTYYTQPSTTGDYKNTSNGTDYVTDRNAINVRFSSIGSSPANYKSAEQYNETYSKKDLLGYTLNSSGKYEKTNVAVIDEFGNLILESSTDSELQKKIQYVKDCQMSSWTKSNGDNTTIITDDTIDYYPLSKVLVINNYYEKVSGDFIKTEVKTNGADTTNYSSTQSTIGGAIDDKSQYINQGYKARQEADVSLKEDIHKATIEINGKTQEYLYNGRKESIDDDSKWEIEVRLSDAYYDTQYSRELYPADYQYKVTSYDDSAKYGKTKDDELKVYVTYKLYVKNQSMSIRTRIDEIVHYYDSDYEYVSDRSYIEIEFGNNKGRYEVRSSDTSRYSSIEGTTTNLDGYQTMYITGLDGIYLDAGQSANIYLTFVIEKDVKDGEDWVKLDEDTKTADPIGVGKESISEINGYSTVYKTGTNIPNVGDTAENTVAGLVDVDSNPGNLNPTDVPKDGEINYENFEDDTDKAPNIRLILYRDENSVRVISGYIWEDERTQIVDSQATATGNGIREDGEKYINGVTVELVEIMDNGTEYIWRTYENGSGTANKTSPIINLEGIIKDYEFAEGTDTTGTYAFKSFVPGNYIVRFKYGDTVKTVLAKDSDATNLLIDEYGLSDELKALLNDTSYNGQDYKSTIYQTGLDTYDGNNTSKKYNYDIAKADTTQVVSDAKDLYDVRENVITYSNGEMTNAFAELLDSYQNVPMYNDASYNKEMMKALLNEFIAKTAMTAETGIINMEVEYNTTQTTGNSVNNTTTYHIVNLDLGLEERPKAQIEINKDVKHLKVTLANGNVLFDANQSTDNLLWQPNLIYGSYKNNMMDADKFTSLSNIRTKRAFGLVQPTMDQELMHGATVRITYEITAKNIGETDYKEQQFYYTGVVENKDTIVTTSAIKVVDYIPNNIQYYDSDNNRYWKVITTEELLNQGLVNSNLEKNLEKFNTIVISDKTNAALVPAIYTEKVDSSKQDSVSIPLVLTQLITTENKTADLTYNNKVELVAQSNTAGRKMAFSVPGNQDPTGDILELDADVSRVSILPPFGATLTYIMIAIILIAGATIIAGGIIFIKKKVLVK